MISELPIGQLLRIFIITLTPSNEIPNYSLASIPASRRHSPRRPSMTFTRI
jgi:hypothetical protein